MNKTNTKTILPKKNTKNTLKYKITKKGQKYKYNSTKKIQQHTNDTKKTRKI